MAVLGKHSGYISSSSSVKIPKRLAGKDLLLRLDVLFGWIVVWYIADYTDFTEHNAVYTAEHMCRSRRGKTRLLYSYTTHRCSKCIKVSSEVILVHSFLQWRHGIFLNICDFNARLLMCTNNIYSFAINSCRTTFFAMHC